MSPEKIGVASVSEPTAARILKEDDPHNLKQFRLKHVVNPERNTRTGVNEWDAEAIARAFCALKVMEEMGVTGSDYQVDYRGIAREVSKRLITGKYKELMATDKWRVVMRRALKEGINFLGTRFDPDKP